MEVTNKCLILLLKFELDFEMCLCVKIEHVDKMQKNQSFNNKLKLAPKNMLQKLFQQLAHLNEFKRKHKNLV